MRRFAKGFGLCKNALPFVVGCKTVQKTAFCSTLLVVKLVVKREIPTTKDFLMTTRILITGRGFDLF